MSNQADVVIIGAGVQGLSAAYHLTKLGVSNVVVVEKEKISGEGSSGRSASLLMLQRENEPKILLSLYSFKRYMHLKEELGADPGYRKIGFLSIATKVKEDIVLEQARLKQKLGVKTEILSPKDIKDRLPFINVEDIVVGVLGPDDGVIDPHAIMEGFAKNARAGGASIRYTVNATGIEVKAGKVTGVHTTDGTISTPIVVNAAGAGAIEVGKWVGLDLPLKNAVRSIFMTDPVPEIPEDSPVVEDAEVEWYYRREGPGVLIGMGKNVSGKVSWEKNLELEPVVREFAYHRVPLLADVRYPSGWSGIRPLTPDILPILGPVPGISGFFNDCGWGGEGIMHSPAGGQIIAESITGKRESGLDHSSFLFSRFAEAQPAPASSENG